MALFTSTDTDGDTLMVANCESGLRQYTVTVSGEDGHRTVILSEDDLARLTEALAQITPVYRG
jgi:hypothetical protein